MGVGGPGVGGLDVGGLGVDVLGVEELGVGVGVQLTSSRHRGLSRAMALRVAKLVGRSLRFCAFLCVRLKLMSGHPIGRGCVTHSNSDVMKKAGAQLEVAMTRRAAP
jgi:hypothetical protein